MTKRLHMPLTVETISKLQVGDRVLLTGTIYTGRDAAHKRLIELLDKGGELPIQLEGQIIYYVGPCPAKPGGIIGSAGPTTSGRMDVYTPRLLAQGLKGMIGKGLRSQEVIAAMQQQKAVYFGAIGGAGALLAQRIKAAEVVAFPELGPEAIFKLKVEDFPVIVLIDTAGNNLYQLGRKEYQRSAASPVD